jgi:hypothetical protein
VIASPNEKVVFTRAKEGGIEALDIATGTQLWVNKDSTSLAGASDKLVFVWVDGEKENAFRVLGLDASTGNTVFKSDAIEMTDWASTTLTYGRSFHPTARGDGQNVVVVWWAHGFYAGGARPTPERVKACRMEASGRVTIDPKTGKVVVEKEVSEAEPDVSWYATVKVGDYRVYVAAFDTSAQCDVGVENSTITVWQGNNELWTRELADIKYLLPLP